MSKIDKKKMIVEETQPQGVSAEPFDRAHERRDVNIRALLISIVVLLGLTGAVMALMVPLFNAMENRAAKSDEEISPMVDTNAYPPAPRLQPMAPSWTTEAQDLGAMRSFEDSLLTTYGWVDKPNGIARIPIDTAIARIAQHGTMLVRNSPATTASDTSGRVTAPIDSVGSAGSGATLPGATLEETKGEAKK